MANRQRGRGAVKSGKGGGGGGRAHRGRGRKHHSPSPADPTPSATELWEKLDLKHRNITSGDARAFYSGFAFFLTSCAVAFNKVTNMQPEPYLDEVFHVPQTKLFCNGTFDKWDPKITTLPGAYLMASGCIRMLQNFGITYNESDPCTLLQLRLFNFVLGIQNFQMIRKIIDMNMLGADEWKKMLAVVNISMFPILFFFNFLFYTDVSSTFWILLMHLLYLRGRYLPSAISGAFATFTRQTNIVWVAFHIILIVSGCLQRGWMKRNLDGFRSLHSKTTTAGVELEENNQTPKLTKSWQMILFKNFVQELKADTNALFWYIGCIIAFIGFVVSNGGIVVGDKEAHAVSLNFPQLGYYTIVFALFASSFLMMRIRETALFIVIRYKWFVAAALLAFLAVHFNTVSHPYLLADNRHYPFYFWKNIVQRYPLARYALIPNYLVVWFFIFKNGPSTPLFNSYAIGLLICAVVQLVPQLLLEFRYFIPLYLFSRFTIPNPTWKELYGEFVVTMFVNIVTVYLFLYHPFAWASEPGVVQRFMW